MARIAMIRMLIVLISIYNLVIHKMNVKTIFFNGELEEKVYMRQPKMVVVKVQEKKV